MTLEGFEKGRILAFGDFDPLGDGRDSLAELAGPEEEAQSDAAEEEGCPPRRGEEVIEGVDQFAFGAGGRPGQGGIDQGDALGEGRGGGPRTLELGFEVEPGWVVRGEVCEAGLEIESPGGEGVARGQGTRAGLEGLVGRGASRGREEQECGDECEERDQPGTRFHVSPPSGGVGARGADTRRGRSAIKSRHRKETTRESREGKPDSAQ